MQVQNGCDSRLYAGRGIRSATGSEYTTNRLLKNRLAPIWALQQRRPLILMRLLEPPARKISHSMKNKNQNKNKNIDRRGHEN
jgi:hypothetical protein